MTSKVNCPNCGTENAIVVKQQWSSVDLVNCEPDNGGCDKYFVVEQRLKLETKTFVLTEKEAEE